MYPHTETPIASSIRLGSVTHLTAVAERAARTGLADLAIETLPTPADNYRLGHTRYSIHTDLPGKTEPTPIATLVDGHRTGTLDIDQAVPSNVSPSR